MSVDSTDLGAAVCRSIMRDMPNRRITLDAYGWPATSPERTPAATAAVADQWCVVLLPLPDRVSVRGHLRYWGYGAWQRPVLNPDAADFREVTFVPYPAVPAAIIGAGYESELRAVVERVIRIVEADYESVKAGAGR